MRHIEFLRQISLNFQRTCFEFKSINTVNYTKSFLNSNGQSLWFWPVLFCVSVYINKEGKVMFGESIVLQAYQT